MSNKPWIKPNSVFLGDPLVIATSAKGYFRWVAGLIISLPLTLWFYGMYSELPGQKEMQIALSLMLGLNVWLFARIVELLRRRLIIEFSGLQYHSLFSQTVIEWTAVKRVEWWYAARERINFY